MPKNLKNIAGHVEHVGRRDFIKKTTLGMAFAFPAIESVTKADILSKGALAATEPSWTITAEVFPGLGTGTVIPASQTVPNGVSATITVIPGPTSQYRCYWSGYRIDAEDWIHGVGPGAIINDTGGTYTFTNVTANHRFQAQFWVE